jgi:hypothetical protein
VALFGLGASLSRGVYLLLFSLVIGAGAIVIGITAVVRARRTASYRPAGAVGGIVLGGLAALISIPILATYLVFPTPLNHYVKCIGQAQTAQQRQACESTFYKEIHLGAQRMTSRRA